MSGRFQPLPLEGHSKTPRGRSKTWKWDGSVVTDFDLLLCQLWRKSLVEPFVILVLGKKTQSHLFVFL